MNTPYLIRKRIESLKQYIAECNSGVDTVAAWKAHKERMKEIK